MIVVNFIDNGSDRYFISTTSKCLGRKWDNNAESIKVNKPEKEKENSCTMIVTRQGKIIDYINVGEDAFLVTSNLSQYDSVEIGFSFSGQNNYVKNSDIQKFYFKEAQKPDDFVAVDPEQSANINAIIGLAFTDIVLKEGTTDTYEFKNLAGDTLKEVQIQGTGGSSGIIEETDPTVPDFVKNISEEDIEIWNNKATTDYVDEQVDDVREVAEGKTKSFTVSTLSDLGTLLGIDTSVVSNEYVITSTTINYKEQSIELKQGDLFLIVDTNVPDYWVSVDDMKIYKMETTKVDLTNYVTFDDIADNTIGVVRQVEYSRTQTFQDGSDAGAIGRAYMRYRDNTENSIVINCQNAKYTLPCRDSIGNFYVGNPTQVYHCATKGYVDNLVPQIELTLKENGAYTLTINKG